MYFKVINLGSTAGGEKWSCTLAYDPNGETGGWDQGWGDSFTAAAIAINPGAYMIGILSTAMTLDGIRLEARDDATDELLGFSEAFRATPLAGAGQAKCPPQVAVVISLRTATAGPSGRGRLYWPGMGVGTDVNGRMTSANQQSLLSDFKTYAAAISGALNTAVGALGMDMCIRSRKTKTSPHVSSIKIGNVLDTQRRRRDKLPETYVSVAYP